MTDLRAAEQQEFPPVPDDKVWCALRGQLVNATDCATDACVAPEQRVVCWMGQRPLDPETFFAVEVPDEQC